MPYEHRITRQVEFAETDAAGIMHYVNFFRFMESAEHSFYRSLGFSVHGQDGGRLYGWPRVHAECDYKEPLKFEDQVEVQLLVSKKGRTSVSYAFIFRKLNGKTPPAEVARGALTVVYVMQDAHNKRMKSVAIPKAIADQIDVAPPGLLG